MNNIVWSSPFEFKKLDGSTVMIDKPVNHNPLVYDVPKNSSDENENEFSYLDNPMSALISLTEKDNDEEGMPRFQARFKVAYDTVQELAFGFFAGNSMPKIVDVLDDGVILEMSVYPVCNITTGYTGDYCWFEREYNSGLLDITEDELDNLDHFCDGTIYEFAVALSKVGSPTVKKYGRTFELVEMAIGKSPEELKGKYYQPELVTTVVSPDGTEWQLIGVEHED